MLNCLSFHLACFGALLALAFSPLEQLHGQEKLVETEKAAELETVAQNQPDGIEAAGEVDDLLSPKRRKAAIERWEDDIKTLEVLDASENDPEDAVLMVGSSSIRLWEGAVEAMAPYPVIRRGYGGAKYSDLYVYAKRLIEPHQFRALVFFVGNDISGGKNDHEVSDVEKWVRAIVDLAREHQPDAALLLVEVTPTPSRFDAWPKIRKLNAMLREVALTEPNVSFVATAEFYLDQNDQPRRDLFRDDNLHQNEPGYQIWASLIKRRLDEVLAAK